MVIVICMLPNSAYVLSKLYLSFPKYLKLCFPLKLFARSKTFAAQNGELSDLVGFALTLATRYKQESEHSD